MTSPFLRYLARRERRRPDAAVAGYRRRLLAGLTGPVIEVGCGEGRNFAHERVRTASRAGALAQRALDATLWPPLVGGCHTARDTETAIRVAGFEIERLERVRHASSWLTAPTAPHILGSARAPH